MLLAFLAGAFAAEVVAADLALVAAGAFDVDDAAFAVFVGAVVFFNILFGCVVDTDGAALSFCFFEAEGDKALEEEVLSSADRVRF